MLRHFLNATICVILLACAQDSAPALTEASPKGKKLSIPLQVDSAFIASADTSAQLSYEDIRKMEGSYAEIENANALRSFINDLCLIDSLKRRGLYDAYLDSIDIGMMQDARAFSLGFIPLGTKSELILWRFWVSSYEACPYYSGDFVIGTLRNGNSFTHIPLGKYLNSGDPPSYSTEKISSEITSDWVSINSETIIDEDMDEPGEEKETHCYTIQFREVSGDSSSTGWAQR